MYKSSQDRNKNLYKIIAYEYLSPPHSGKTAAFDLILMPI